LALSLGSDKGRHIIVIEVFFQENFSSWKSFPR
jgi:hypothetical protein